MAKIVLNEFKGIMPKLSDDKLPINMCQVAADIKTASAELVAYRRSTADVLLPGSSYKTIFEYIEGGNNHWVYYDLIVHWVRSPVADDTYERMYLTGADSVNGKYKAFASNLISGSFDFTTDFYYPGAPSGQAPTITAVTPATDYVAYFYTFTSNYGEQGPASAVGELPTATDDSRNYIDDITYPSTYPHLIGTGPETESINIYRTVDTGAGEAAFLHILDATWFQPDVTYSVGDYVFTDQDGSGTWNLYECTVGGIGTWAGGTHTFVKGENVLAVDAGSTCESIFYDEAPTDLSNLRGHPNGFFVAFKNNVLYFTEPYAPWAWPEDYQIPIDQTIVGLGIFGSTIVVCTDGFTYTFSGPHPTTLYKKKLSFNPCLSQRAIAETYDGVMFPSLEGFQMVSSAGTTNVTQDLFKPEDWVEYALDTMHGTWYNKAYYGFFSSALYKGHIIIDFLNNSITTGNEYHHAGHVAVLDGIFRTVFPADIESATNLYIARWDADPTEYRLYSYTSPKFILERPANFKLAQVILDTDFLNNVETELGNVSKLQTLNAAAFALGDLRSTFNGFLVGEQQPNGDTLYSARDLGIQTYVNFQVYVDGGIKFVKKVYNSTAFKLPRGFKDKKWEIEVEGMIPVKRIIMATSTEELQDG